MFSPYDTHGMNIVFDFLLCLWRGGSLRLLGAPWPEVVVWTSLLTHNIIVTTKFIMFD